MLTLLTTTGARPDAWALCQRWMRRQTYAGPVRWIVVDDGAEPQATSFQREGWSVEVVRREPFWRPGQNTQAANLLAGLARVADDDALVIIEDDDWYGPGWLAEVAPRLQRADALVGERRARYYNVATRTARPISNLAHASLCSTALRGRWVRELRRAAAVHHKFIDLQLWRQPGPGKALLDTQHVVGIKGLPGRGGIGMGHSGDMRGTSDADCRLLRQWVGADADLYLDVMARGAQEHAA